MSEPQARLHRPKQRSPGVVERLLFLAEANSALAPRFRYIAAYGSLRHPIKGDYVWRKKKAFKLVGRRYRQACREWHRAVRNVG